MTQLSQGFLDEISKYPQLSLLAQSLLTEPEVSVRLNDAKIKDTGINVEIVPWCDLGYYLDSRPQFTFDPKLHQGLYYVQDASSMALFSVLKDLTAGKCSIKYLDACAAPGGKTTTALSALPSGSVVVANEYDFRRAEILAENVSKWGNPNVLVSRGDTSRFRKLKNTFDIVAVDAPCSGEGMMRKDIQAVEQWSPSLVRQCAETQREILANVWDSLRPGGFLIYSTCTFNTHENEENLCWIIEELGGSPIEIKSFAELPQIERGIGITHPCYRFIPGMVKGEGLFIAVVQKPGSAISSPTPKSKPSKTNNDLSKLSDWFNQDMEFLQIDEDVYAVPKENAAFLRNAASMLDTILVGTHAATIKGRDIKPVHELALSTALNQDAFASCELDYVSSIKYLQRENISLPDGTPKGNVLLKYENAPLGFVKNLGNRSNTTMPKNWRIISQNIPALPPKIL